MPVELFLEEEFEEAATGVTLTLANTSQSMDALDMMEVKHKLIWELYIICYLLRQGSQLTTRDGVCLVKLRLDIFEYI
jgi:hypothetical protein